MTQWVENPTGGRDRGPQAIVRAWVEVMLRPRRFFNVGVAPGDQAPGLVFGVLVTVIEVTSRMVFGGSAVGGTVGGDSLLSKLFIILAVGLFVAPAVLHLTAALQTVVLLLVVPDRAGISETVQVIGYAVAPCLFAGLPFPELRAACTLYGAILLTVGTSEVHNTSLVRATVGAAIPSALVFGYGFRGFAAFETVFPSLAALVPW
ncbi:YIP1 family protein [Haladaptatus caseinilyticus]|uniref:YIP1 family protein n=1 Tax=Haladaptatus caseinilyticus TaxID=2993314 RepID=UPI00224B4FCE|nr:YIP1 family protein [Haladaptatus caseinilyticus]